MAERFSCRPSALLSIEDEAAALDVDMAAWVVLVERDREAMEQAQSANTAPGATNDDVQVYVDGKLRGSYTPRLDSKGDLVREPGVEYW